MLALKQYEATSEFDPLNPQQRIRELWGWQGTEGWHSWYWNPQPTTSSLNGLGGWSALSSTTQLVIVGGVAALVGFFGMKKFGDSHVRPALKKVGLAGLAGPRRRRRRR